MNVKAEVYPYLSIFLGRLPSGTGQRPTATEPTSDGVNEMLCVLRPRHIPPSRCEITLS